MSILKVGCYTSPHLFKVNERLQINGISISDKELLTHLKVVEQYFNYKCSFFAALTFVCHLYFLHHKIDIAIIEVGIGGRLDVTNLFNPIASIITTVALDHCDLLGDSVEQIGFEKAHIYRSQLCAYYADINIPASILNYAKLLHSNLVSLGNDYFIEDDWLILSGVKVFDLSIFEFAKYQYYNIAITIVILLQLGYSLTSKVIKGIKNTKLIGRFELINNNLLFDVAHNVQSVNNMINTLSTLPHVNETAAIFSCKLSKDVCGILSATVNHIDKWYLLSDLLYFDHIPCDTLKRELLSLGVSIDCIVICKTVYDAMHLFYSAKNRLVCFGSFITVVEAYKSYMRL